MPNTFVEFIDDRIVPHLETILTVFLLIVAIYMYFGAYDFPEAPSQFPQMAAAVVILTGSIVLFWDYFPEKVKMLEADNPIESLEGDLFGEEEMEDGGVQEAGNDLSFDDEVYDKYGILPLHYHVGILSILYAAIGWLFGLFWATPLVVFAYSRVSDLSWLVTGILVVLSIATAWGFYDVLNAPILEGLLHDWGYL